QGAEFRIVIADLAVQAHPQVAERIAFQRSLQLKSLDAIDQYLKNFGAARHIPVFALSGPLGDYAASHNVFLHGAPPSTDNFGHWNKAGNEQVGHAIAENL